MELLIVSAAKFEVDPLLRELYKKQVNYSYFELGVGPIHAAKKYSELEKICAYKKVLYIGTCGSFAPFHKPYLIQAEKTYWMPTGLRSGLSHAQESWYPPLSFTHKSKLDLPKKVILTSPELSLNPKISSKLNLGIKEELYENMELYPIAEALKKSPSLEIILAVTNEIGERGHEQWKKNFKEVALLTRDFVLDYIAEL